MFFKKMQRNNHNFLHHMVAQCVIGVVLCCSAIAQEAESKCEVLAGSVWEKGSTKKGGINLPIDLKAALLHCTAAVKLSRSPQNLFRLARALYSAHNDQEAIVLLRESANSNYGPAQAWLGELYLTGASKIRADYEAAKQWLKKSIDQGHVPALYLMGYLHASGPPPKRNMAKAVQFYNKAAAAGHPDAQLELGILYYNGDGVDKDWGRAETLFKSAAMQGHVRGQYILGFFYANHKSPEIQAKAIMWLNASAKSGNADAQYQLGSMYLHGIGVSKDLEAAEKWLQLAGRNKHGQALYLLGYMNFNGVGGTKDLSKAANLFLEFTKYVKLPDSFYQLGRMYYYGWGVEKDVNKAVSWWQQAADLGHPAAMEWMGQATYLGIGITKNAEEAFKWYKRAAEAGAPLSQHNVGVMLEKGDGIKKDPEEALLWFERSAKNGHTEAMLALGLKYELGRTVKRNFAKAKRFYELAMQNKHPDAAKHLEMLKKKIALYNMPIADVMKLIDREIEEIDSDLVRLNKEIERLEKEQAALKGES